MRRCINRNALILLVVLASSHVVGIWSYQQQHLTVSRSPSWRSSSSPSRTAPPPAVVSPRRAASLVVPNQLSLSLWSTSASSSAALFRGSSARCASYYCTSSSTDSTTRRRGSTSILHQLPSAPLSSSSSSRHGGRTYDGRLSTHGSYRHPVRASIELGAVASALDDPPGNDHESAAAAADSTLQTKSRRRSYHWTKPTLALAIPALVGMLADPVLSLVDTAYVGRVGSMELAALGSCTSLFHLAFNAFRATTAATTSLVANSLSGDAEQVEDPLVDVDIINLETTALSTDVATTTPTNTGIEDAQRVSWISLQLGFVMGMVVWIGLAAGGPFALRCMGVPNDSPLYRPASEYLYARSWAAPVVLLITVSEGIFRGHGNTVVPLVASLTAAVMNLVLDPILMFRPIHWGVAGAAAATAISQCGAAAVYGWQLLRRHMLPPDGFQQLLRRRSSAASDPAAASTTNSARMNRSVIRTILGANLSMMIKQGSLLLGWAFATARATRLGPQHVAAHQVALSVWLFFALVLDGAAVASQVLMSRAYHSVDRHQASSLIRYMTKWALVQGLLSMVVLDGLDQAVPQIFTPDKSIQSLLHTIMPHLAAQQVLVSLTLVVESLAAGANQFGMLAFGTALSTVAAVWQIGLQTSVDGIWSVGITTLFAGRLVTACLACFRALRSKRRRR